MKKIILLGAGYANLTLIKNLPKTILDQYELILISKTPLHYFSVLLHEVVSGAKQAEVTRSIQSIIPHNVQFIQDEILEILEDKVKGKQGIYHYDTLIVGLGFQSDDFNILGIKEYAMPIVDYEGASKLYQNLQSKIQDFKEKQCQNPFRIIVCGAGFSGIETVATLAEELSLLWKQLNLNPQTLELLCIEAMPHILPMFPPNLAQSATRYLQKLGVKLELNCKILECQEDGIIIQRNHQNEKIKASFVIWTAGVKGNAVIENSPFFTSTRSRVEVDSYLQPIHQKEQDQMKHIFIIGDCSMLKEEATGKFYPPTAQLAIKMGEYLAKVLPSHLNSKPIPYPFKFKPKGTVCSLGSKYAIASIGQLSLKGRLAMLLKRYIEAKWRNTL